jgi:hypothetical protein
MLGWSVKYLLEVKQSPSTQQVYVWGFLNFFFQGGKPKIISRIARKPCHKGEHSPVTAGTVNNLYVKSHLTHKSVCNITKMLSVFPISRGIFGTFCSYSFPRDTAWDMLASKYSRKLWIHESRSWSPGQDFNPSPPEYKAGIILTKMRHSVL